MARGQRAGGFDTGFSRGFSGGHFFPGRETAKKKSVPPMLNKITPAEMRQLGIDTSEYEYVREGYKQIRTIRKPEKKPWRKQKSWQRDK